MSYGRDGADGVVGAEGLLDGCVTAFVAADVHALVGVNEKTLSTDRATDIGGEFCLLA